MQDITPETFTAVVLLASLSIVATLIGVGLALRLGANARAIAVGVGFSVGIMILIALGELIPEAVSAGGSAPTAGAVLAGMALVALAHVVVPHSHLVEEPGRLGQRSVRAVYLTAVGLILHDFPEGIAMANSYVASPSLGVLTAIAVAAHNIPEEFAMAAPAVLVRRRRLLFGAAALSALAEPLGAIVGLLAVTARPGLNAWLLAFAAGAMLYVAVHELIPMAREHGHPKAFVLGAGGSIVVFAVLRLSIEAAS